MVPGGLVDRAAVAGVAGSAVVAAADAAAVTLLVVVQELAQAAVQVHPRALVPVLVPERPGPTVSVPAPKRCAGGWRMRLRHLPAP